MSMYGRRRFITGPVGQKPRTLCFFIFITAVGRLLCTIMRNKHNNNDDTRIYRCHLVFADVSLSPLTKLSEHYNIRCCIILRTCEQSRITT